MADEMAVPKTLVRRLRGGIAAWIIVSAVFSPLITVYCFLANHGRLPAVSVGAGVFTILVNACMVTFLILWLGLLSGYGFTAMAMRDDSWWRTIGKAILLLLVGLALMTGRPFSQEFTLVGALMLVSAVCSLTPLARVIEAYFIQIAVLVATLTILAVMLLPGWGQDWWATASGRPTFSIVPLSSMDISGWGCAAFGAAVYVAAYIFFQQWRTQGKWLGEVGNLINPKS
jgi:hypothetical protein